MLELFKSRLVRQTTIPIRVLIDARGHSPLYTIKAFFTSCGSVTIPCFTPVGFCFNLHGLVRTLWKQDSSLTPHTCEGEGQQGNRGKADNWQPPAVVGNP
jgi:hypothetical protein